MMAKTDINYEIPGIIPAWQDQIEHSQAVHIHVVAGVALEVRLKGWVGIFSGLITFKVVHVGFFNLTYTPIKQSRRNVLTREIIKLPR